MVINQDQANLPLKCPALELKTKPPTQTDTFFGFDHLTFLTP